MMIRNVFLVLLIVLTACKTDSKKIDQSQANKSNTSVKAKPPINDDIELDIIQWSQATLNDLQMVTDESDLIKRFGKPIQLREKCSAAIVRPLSNKIEYVYYNCLVFKNQRNKIFGQVEDVFFLESIDFENSDELIKTPQLDLSKNTTVAQLKEAFPNSFKNKNSDNNAESLDEIFEWIYVYDDFSTDKKPLPGKVELKFRDGKLKNLRYRFEKDYTDEQWRKYTQLKGNK